MIGWLARICRRIRSGEQRSVSLRRVENRNIDVGIVATPDERRNQSSTHSRSQKDMQAEDVLLVLSETSKSSPPESPHREYPGVPKTNKSNKRGTTEQETPRDPLRVIQINHRARQYFTDHFSTYSCFRHMFVAGQARAPHYVLSRVCPALLFGCACAVWCSWRKGCRSPAAKSGWLVPLFPTYYVFCFNTHTYIFATTDCARSGLMSSVQVTTKYIPPR